MLRNLEMHTGDRKKIILQSLRNLLVDESGQGTVEYMLILMASIVGATQISKALLSVIQTGLLTLGGTLEKDLRTGRVGLNAWSN